MTEQQKNQAIADRCPLKFALELIGPYGPGWYYWLDGQLIRCLNGSIIDDLNAMRIAEDTLTDEQEVEYADKLCGKGSVFATSRQRADAFAKVFVLW